MGTTFRQDPQRYDEIEIGDTVTYIATTITVARERYTDGEWVKVPETVQLRPGYYPTAKVIERDGDGWKLEGAYAPRLTRETFWALRKARGKGKSGERRFSDRDAIVTCQVCAGKWIGNSGRLPHHGYLRPGWGQQTASCPGALELAYSVVVDPEKRVAEIGRYVLPAVIAAYDRRIEHAQNYLSRVRAGTVAVPSEWATTTLDHDDPRLLPVQPGDSRYERQREIEQRSVEGELRHLTWERQFLQERYDDWQPGGDVDRVLVSSLHITKESE
jgi:hypothetical protein